MIKSFKHKGLEKFFHSGHTKGIDPEHAPKIARILDRLDASTTPHDMNLPGYKLHALKGKEKRTPGSGLVFCISILFTLKTAFVTPSP